MEKRLIQLFLAALVLLLFWNVWDPFWRGDLNEAVDPDDEDKIVFEIEKGSSAKSIADNLEDEDLIVSEKSFVRTLENEELSEKVRYGKFVLSPSMTLREIVTILTTEGTGELALTVPEGWTIDDIDAKLTEMGLIDEGVFRACAFNCTFDFDFINKTTLEGYLFPDTYFIDSATFSSEILINQMLQNFKNRFSDEMQQQLSDSGRSLYDTIIVASLIEKEVRTDGDLETVSGIIWKRLDNDWMLGIDAALLYNESDNEISAEDLEKDTPYNTRINKGLPPTPISNPGLASIQAALNPEESDYWFYLTDSEGEVHYAETNAEHEENKAKYL